MQQQIVDILDRFDLICSNLTSGLPAEIAARQKTVRILTSFWADANNRVLPDLVDFTKTFFCKHTILNILTRYCVFTAENMLLVMRPYQIVATERILNRIEIANNYKKYGTIAGGGYIWHTTGSDGDEILHGVSAPNEQHHSSDLTIATFFSFAANEDDPKTAF